MHAVMNCTQACDSVDQITARMSKLYQFVDAHRNSTALLSWYICDDCPCGGDAASDAKRHALSLVYSLLKEYDPYHITSGAGGCGNMYSLGEPYALSLDQIMYENYDPEPRDHFGDGSWPGGKGVDGGFRHYPITFEPLCNLQGFYTVYASHTSHPPFSRCDSSFNFHQTFLTGFRSRPTHQRLNLAQTAAGSGDTCMGIHPHRSDAVPARVRAGATKVCWPTGYRGVWTVRTVGGGAEAAGAEGPCRADANS